MDEKKDIITSKQLMIFLITAQIGTSIITLPSRLAEDVGHDGWISVILAWLISYIILFFILALLKRYINKSIFEISILIFGKYLGALINLFILAYTFFLTVILLRESIEALHITIYNRTPELLLTCAFIIPAVYLCWYGIKPFCRFSTIIFSGFFILLIIFALASTNFKINFIKPIGYNGTKIVSKGILPSFSSFLGMELLAIFYPHVTDKDKAVKYVMLGNSISGIFYTLVVLVSIGIFGENLVKHLMFPLINIPRIIKMPFIERMDVYFFSLWLPLMSASGRAFFICTLYGTRKVFKFQMNKVYYALLIIIIILLSRIPPDLDAILNYKDILDIYGIAICLYLIVCYLLSFIIKRGVEVK